MARKPKTKVRDVLDDHERGIRPGAAALGAIAVGLSSMIVWNAFFGVHDGGKARRATAQIPQGATTRIEVTPPSKEIRTVSIQYDPRVETVQRDLLDSGHYQGFVDGVMGKQTVTAIRRYQQENGLAASGAITRELLDHIKYRKKLLAAAEVTGSISPQEVAAPPVARKKAVIAPLSKQALEIEEPLTRKAVPPPRKKVVEQKQPVEKPAAKTAAAKPAGAKPVVAKPKVVAEPATPVKKKSAPAVKVASASTGGIARVRDVQSRLRRMGYPIRVVNGEPDKETRAAILQFQMEHDLPLDGVVTGALVAALKISEAARTAQAQ